MQERNKSTPEYISAGHSELVLAGSFFILAAVGAMYGYWQLQNMPELALIGQIRCGGAAVITLAAFALCVTYIKQSNDKLDQAIDNFLDNDQ